jgi:hypothetical protein
MPVNVVVLYTIYALEILSLMGCLGYVAYLHVKRDTYINPYLKGRRLKVGAVLPFVWITYVMMDAYIVHRAGTPIDWEIPSFAINLKIVLQILSLIGSIILALLLMGCKFGDK